jgi:glycosyltransferase involved in cell wall biosynthesis
MLYRERLETWLNLDEVRYAPLTELRRLPPMELVQTLRAFDFPEICVAVEDLHSQAALPLLKAVACLTSARTMCIVYPDFQTEKQAKYRALNAILTLGSRSTLAWLAVGRAWTETKRLLATQRVDVSRGAGRHRVLYLKTNFMLGLKAGGSVGHIQGIVEGLANAGYDLDYCSSEPPLHSHDRVEYVDVPLPKTFGYPFEANYYTYHHNYIGQLSRRLDPCAYTFIYHRISICNYAGIVLSRNWRLPLVVEYNGSDAWIQKHWDRPLKFQRLAEAVEDASIRHAHVVVVQSEVLRQEMLDRQVDPARIVVYPNCVDTSQFSPDRFSVAESSELRKRLGIPDDAVVVTFVGTFGQWHGTEVLAEAIRRLAAHRGEWLRSSKLRFLLIGDGLKMQAVKHILDTPACRECCVMTGLIPQMETPAYLAASDILVSPHAANADGTRFFGSPTKLFEYMSMGKGIVASDLEQLGEVLRDSVRVGQLPTHAPSPDARQIAVLTPPGSIEGLMEGIAFLVDQPRWRVRLGQNARNEVERRYTWKHHVTAILERFDSLYPCNCP